MRPEKCQLYTFNPDVYTVEENNLDLDQIKKDLSAEKVFWLNFHRIPDTDELMELSHLFKIHRTTREDISGLSERPKVEEFDDYLFFSLASFVPSKKGVSTTEQISFILSENFLISIQERKSDHFSTVRERIINNTGILRSKKSDYLLYRLLDCILDNYFTVLEKISAEIESLDFEATSSPTPDVLNKIEQNKRILIHLRKLIHPIKEIVSRLDIGFPKFINSDNEPYFRDIKDTAQSLLDEVDTNKQILDSLTQLYYATLSHRMNEIMKVLTMVGAIFIPLTFIAGIYGMNFTNMPELEWKYSYFVAWGVMITLAVVLMIYFKRKKWF